MHSPSTDELFDALSNVHRRRLLVGLLEHNPQTVDRLSIASQDCLGMNSGLLEEFLGGTQEIDGVDKGAIRLYHTHLPKLVDYGFVEWDPDENDVQKGPKFDEIRPLLVLLAENPEVLPDDWV